MASDTALKLGHSLKTRQQADSRLRQVSSPGGVLAHAVLAAGSGPDNWMPLKPSITGDRTASAASATARSDSRFQDSK